MRYAISVLAEHVVVKVLFSHCIEHFLVLVHLLLIIHPVCGICFLTGLVSLHSFEDGCEIGQEKNSHTDVFITV